MRKRLLWQWSILWLLIVISQSWASRPLREQTSRSKKNS